MKIIRYPAGVYQANCYIVYDEKANEGFIVDPGGDGEGILNKIRQNNINIKFIILTHGHFDHIGAVNSLKHGLNIPVYINENDNSLVSGNIPLFKSMFPKTESVAADKFIKDGDKFIFGNEEILVLETPGHTPGGVCIKAGDSVFSGDTLFLSSVGRTDLPGGSHEQLIKSIEDKILPLPDETKVYPGHGPSTTVGRERKSNPYL